jgi:hypothetical protein
VIVILGDMGDGKTDFAGLLGQLWERNQNEKPLIGSNIQSLRERTEWEGGDGWIPDYGSLVEWLQQDGDPFMNEQQPKLFIGDEFSSAASGRGKQGYETAMKMAPLVYKIRKYNGALIYIAHGPKSIHPMLWRVGTIVKKTSQKKAVIADRLNGTRLDAVRDRLDGIPPTDWRFDTDEASPWSWSNYNNDEEEIEEDDVVEETAIYTVIRGKQMGLSTRDIAEFVPFGKSWVGSRWREYEQEDEHARTVDSIESIIQ